MDGGIDDVGLGVLFGLELYQYEFAGLLMHAEHLEAVHGVGPAHHQRSPRQAGGRYRPGRVRQRHRRRYLRQRSCACIRIAVPYTGMIISTRESQAVREKAAPPGHLPDQRRFPHLCGRLSPNKSRTRRLRAVRRQSDQRTLDEVVRLAHGDGLHPRPSAPPATEKAVPATGS